jgi:hypothetical protein
MKNTASLAVRRHSTRYVRDLFVLYADRELMTPAMVARIETQFHLRTDRTEVKSGFHYQSPETPTALATRSKRPERR